MLTQLMFGGQQYRAGQIKNLTYRGIPRGTGWQ